MIIDKDQIRTLGDIVEMLYSFHESTEIIEHIEKGVLAPIAMISIEFTPDDVASSTVEFEKKVEDAFKLSRQVYDKGIHSYHNGIINTRFSDGSTLVQNTNDNSVPEYFLNGEV